MSAHNAEEVRRELRWRANRGDILCLNEHVAHTDHVDVWLCCGAKEVGRYTPPIGEAAGAQEWLHRMMDRHRMEVAERLARELLNDGSRRGYCVHGEPYDDKDPCPDDPPVFDGDR